MGGKKRKQNQNYFWEAGGIPKDSQSQTRQWEFLTRQENNTHNTLLQHLDQKDLTICKNNSIIFNHLQAFNPGVVSCKHTANLSTSARLRGESITKAPGRRWSSSSACHMTDRPGKVIVGVFASTEPTAICFYLDLHSAVNGGTGDVNKSG